MHGLTSNKTLIIPINFTISSLCREKIEMVQQSSVYTFIHIFVSYCQITMRNEKWWWNLILNTNGAKGYHVTCEKMPICWCLYIYILNILMFNLSSLPLSLASYLRKMIPWLITYHHALPSLLTLHDQQIME